MALIPQYDKTGTRLADFDLTATMLTRISAADTYPAQRLNPWRLATFDAGAGNVTAEVFKSGSTYTEIRLV